MTTSRYAPTIDDLLRDPITQAIMKADRVDPSELEAMLRALASQDVHAAGPSNDDSHDIERGPPDYIAITQFLRSADRGPTRTSRYFPARSGIRSQLCGGV